MKKFNDYFIGLDVGTDSVGWAVTDNNYNILRLKGKDAWGSRIFDDAKDAKSRRQKRANKRRINRRKYRIFLLNELFSNLINEVDNTFFIRLNESNYVFEDKSTKNPYLFLDKDKEKAYYKKYPTELTEAEKQLILAVAQDTAYQTAEATALKVAQDVATQTAETTAITVAQSIATQTAGATATQTATQVGNQAKQKFTNQVVSQMSTLGTALDELTNGLANIDNGVSALSVGTNKLDSGALQLANGVKTFNEQGISKINNLVNGDLRNIASRVEKMNELANEYNNYAGIQNGMAGEVKFIMITDSTTGNGEVKKEEAVITTEAKDSKEIKENKEE